MKRCNLLKTPENGDCAPLSFVRGKISKCAGSTELSERLETHLRSCMIKTIYKFIISENWRLSSFLYFCWADLHIFTAILMDILSIIDDGSIFLLHAR